MASNNSCFCISETKMSFFKEILVVNIEVMLNDESEINISDPVKALL